MAFIPFTNEQLIRANTVDLVEFLRLKGEKLERCGKEHKLVYADKGIEVDGNSILSEFSIKDKDKKIIGTIKKKLVSMKDTYDIKFDNEDDELLVVMLALLVDETFHG